VGYVGESHFPTSYKTQKAEWKEREEEKQVGAWKRDERME